jgi:peptidoglycan hydrolase CwlO-like protein
MGMEWMIGVGGLVLTLGSLYLGWTAHARTNRQETAKDAASDATLRQDVEYIKKGIDTIQCDIKSQGEKVDKLSDRTARVEESCKSAHHRLDRIDEILSKRNS